MASPAPSGHAARSLLAEVVRFLPGIGVLGSWIALMPADGGYFARDWGLAGLSLVGLWLLAVIGHGRLLPSSGAARVALCALAGLCALGFLSALWADPPGSAFAGASQMLTVTLSVWTLALMPWRAGSAQLLMMGFTAGAAVVAGGALVSALGAEALGDRFIEDRWGEPIGYPNALGAFGVVAMLPALAVSACPERGIATKAAALALATLVGGLGLLPQSRGAVLSAVIAAVVLIVLSPRGWRTAARVAVTGAALAVAAPAIFDVFDAAEKGTGVGEALDGAARAIVLAALAAGVAGAVLAFAESRVRLGESGARRSRLAGFAAAAVLVLAGAGLAASRSDAIRDTLDRQRTAWTSEKLIVSEEGEGTRLLSSDPLQRYLYWHVALDAFADRPLAGLGAGGFESRYTLERKETKYAAYPHSLLMRALAEGGILGLLGLLVFVAAVLWGLLRRLGDATPGARTVSAAALAVGAAFFTHAQLDWLEEFPVLVGAAAGFLLVALAVREPEPSPRALGRPSLVGAVAAAALLLVVLGLPYAAVRYRERAVDVWRSDPAAAYRDLDRSAALAPLDDAAHLAAGAIALQQRDYPRARRSFEAALERENGWLARFELAIALAGEGDRRAAVRQLDLAADLNPQEVAIPAARREISGNRPIDPVALNRRLFESPLFSERSLT